MAVIINTMRPRGGDARRDAQERGYEETIVRAAYEIVDPETTPERRERCWASLVSACEKFAARHGLDAGRLVWGAIRRAREARED
jgi:hypothetical protein